MNELIKQLLGIGASVIGIVWFVALGYDPNTALICCFLLYSVMLVRMDYYDVIKATERGNKGIKQDIG